MIYRLLGIGLLSSPFVTLFIAEWVSEGLAKTLLTWGMLLLLVMVIFGGIALYDKGSRS